MNHYEIHLTVRTNEIERFRQTCADIRVKPIVIDLQDKAGNTLFHDVMTSSTVKGNPNDWKYTVGLVSNQLQTAGFDVVRRKVEESPYNDPLGKSLYYESHVRVKTVRTQVSKLRQVSGLFHVSRNIFKVLEGDAVYMMLTYRDTCSFEEFAGRLAAAKMVLDLEGFEYDKVEIESVIYDSNLEHDRVWTS